MKSVSVAFRVRVMRAGERARRSCVSCERRAPQRRRLSWQKIPRREMPLLRFCCYAYVFLLFHTGCWYMCGLFDLFVFTSMRMFVRIGLAGRPS